MQYEFEFECEASSWNYIRMPFNGFKAVRASPYDRVFEVIRCAQMGSPFLREAHGSQDEE